MRVAEIGVYGPRDLELRWASVTKLLTGVALLVAVEEGTVDLDEPAGPPGSTLRHLLAHASGLPPDEGPPLMPPARRRIYSNYGIELAAALVAERAGMPFAEYFRAAVVEPLALDRRAARLAGVGLPRTARRSAEARPRAARADARRAGDARRGDLRPVPRPRGRAAELRAGWIRTTGASPSSSATRRSPHWTSARQLAADVRPLRCGRHVSLGRSRARRCLRRAHRQGVRRLGDRRVAALQRPSRRRRAAVRTRRRSRGRSSRRRPA